jgi:hypothetical protein
MQIIDTNFTLIDTISEYDFDYLNGYCDIKTIENIQKKFIDYCEQIKV